MKAPDGEALVDSGIIINPFNRRANKNNEKVLGPVDLNIFKADCNVFR